MLQRGYIILIIGAVLFISGAVISIFWAGSFVTSFLHQGIILSNVAVAPATTASNTIQVNDISHLIALQIRIESISTTTGQAANLREVVKDSTGKVLSQNDFSKQFFTTFKPTIPGAYTLLISNLGSAPVRIAALFGSASFVNENNHQFNVNFFGGIITGIILVIIGIITIIAGIIILILDRRKGKGKEYIATR
jgi:flagellar basal body-associated protein FliL